MQGNLYYKKYIEKLINTNPTTITITRVTKTDDGYGGHTETKATHAVTVTFYDKKAKREIITDYGTTYTGVSVTKILALGDSNILEGDTFSNNGNEYRVAFVNNYFDICKQIELDVI